MRVGPAEAEELAGSTENASFGPPLSRDKTEFDSDSQAIGDLTERVGIPVNIIIGQSPSC